MLARAPGDVAHANVAQVTVPRRQRGSPRPAWGNGAVCPATPGANAHGVPRTAITSANGAPSRPAGRVQPCRFDLLPPCTPITARQRTRRPGWASRAARTGPLPGDQATVPPQDGARRDQPVRPQPSRQEPDQRGQHRPAGLVPPGPGQVRRSTATSCRSTSSSVSLNAGEHRQDKPASKPHEDQTAQTHDTAGHHAQQPRRTYRARSQPALAPPTGASLQLPGGQASGTPQEDRADLGQLLDRPVHSRSWRGDATPGGGAARSSRASWRH